MTDLHGTLLPGLVWRFAIAFAAAAALVPAFRRVALRRGYVARPREDRWHSRPTALLGGVGIAVPVFAVTLATGNVRAVAVPLACGALMFVVGLVDDVMSLKPSTKLIAEIALAGAIVASGERLHWADWTALDLLLTMVWLVGVTNALNLLDNMDGLCAGITLIGGIGLLAGIADRPDVLATSHYLAIVLGATAGFLVYNVHPASIFMGDAGSLFLGLTLATLTLTAGGPAHDRTRVLSIVVAPVLVLLIPIFDTTLVTVSRLLSGRPVSKGGRDHSSHRLVAIGLSEQRAVRVLWGLGAAAGIMGLWVRRFADQDAWLIGALFVLAMAVFAVYLAQVRVYSEPSAIPKSGVTPVILNFMYKRRVAEVLLDVCLVVIAYYGAWRLRFEGPEWDAYVHSLLQSLPIAVALQMIALFVFGAYRGAWRYFGLMDGVSFAKGVGAGTAAVIIAVVYLYRFEQYSRGVFVIYAVLLLVLLGGSRASFRLIGEFARRRTTGRRLIIYGVREAGPLLLNELMRAPDERYQMVGFIDDDPGTHNLRVQGYRVLGGEARLIDLIQTHRVDVLVVGATRVPSDRLRRVEAECLEHDVAVLRFSFKLERLAPSA